MNAGHFRFLPFGKWVSHASQIEIASRQSGYSTCTKSFRFASHPLIDSAMSKKPTVFIASSVRAKDMLRELKQWLEEDHTIKVKEWMTDTFAASQHPLDELLKASQGCDYAIMVMWPDDKLELAGSNQQIPMTRDNVIFEAGLFTGKHGRECVFYWQNSEDVDLRVPTDLTGLTQVRYIWKSDPNESMGQQICNAARKLRKQIESHWKTSAAGSSTLTSALLACFNREWITRPGKPPLHFDPHRELLDREDVYDSFVASGSSPRSGIVIFDRDTRWFWDLFPLVLHWRLNNIPVGIVSPEPHDSQNKGKQAADEKRRRALLENLGCNVIQAPVEKCAYIIDPYPGADTKAFVFGHEKENYYATCFSRNTDQAEIEKFDTIINAHWPTGFGIAFAPSVNAVSEDEVKAKLLGAHGPAAYKQSGISMAMEDVKLDSVFSISLAVRTYRFRQIDLLSAIFRQNNLRPFECAAVKLLDGTFSLITPPVMESHLGQSVFIEGNTRALHSYYSELKTIRALCVTGVTMNPPAKPNPLEDVFLCRLKLPPAWRQLDWKYGAFRDIEAAMHNYP